MPLTPAQNAAIKADILANPDLAAIPAGLDGAYAIADLYNKTAVPDFIVWKVRLHEQDIASLTSAESTVWSWVAFIARSASEQAGWGRMFNGTYTVNPSLLQVRNGFADIFSGGTGVAQRAHLTAISKEPAKRLEKLLATGTGTILDPATRVFVGNVSYNEIHTARTT